MSHDQTDVGRDGHDDGDEDPAAPDPLRARHAERDTLFLPYDQEFAGELPLVLTLNAKTDIPPDDAALSSTHAGVEEAVRLGADAVVRRRARVRQGPAYDKDFRELRRIRQRAVRLGMPLIVWAYPRGSAIGARSGRTW